MQIRITVGRENEAGSSPFEAPRLLLEQLRPMIEDLKRPSVTHNQSLKTVSDFL